MISDLCRCPETPYADVLKPDTAPATRRSAVQRPCPVRRARASGVSGCVRIRTRVAPAWTPSGVSAQGGTQRPTVGQCRLNQLINPRSGDFQLATSGDLNLAVDTLRLDRSQALSASP